MLNVRLLVSQYMHNTDVMFCFLDTRHKCTACLIMHNKIEAQLLMF
jgi:hypothetical protein